MIWLHLSGVSSPPSNITSDTHNQIQDRKKCCYCDVAEGETWPGNNTTCMHISTQAHTHCWSLSAAGQGPSYWTRQIVTSFDSSGHTQMRAANCLARAQTWHACDRKRYWRVWRACRWVCSEWGAWVSHWKVKVWRGKRAQKVCVIMRD